MKKEKIIIIGMGVIIFLLLFVIVIPKITYSFGEKYFIQGYQACITNTVSQIVSDLEVYGYTQIYIENQTITLGVLNVSSSE